MKAEANESVLGERVTKVKFHGRDQVPEASKLLKKTAAKLFPSVTMRGSRSSDKLIAMWQQPKSEGSKAFEAIKKKATGMGFKKSKPIRGDGEYGGWGSSDAFGLEREDSQEEFAMPPFRLVLGDYGNFKGAMKAPIYSARLYFDGPTYVSLMGKSEEIIRKQRALAGIEDYQEPLQEDDNIGRTILQQMGGAGRIKAMTGGGPFILLPKGVSFKFPNKKRTRGNYVEITLRGDDTYNMEFFNVSVKGKKSVKKYTMIYNDQLISIFEDQTGLYLRL